jgi:RNA polymerase sigma-70 factor (ECF subfamily)
MSEAKTEPDQRERKSRSGPSSGSFKVARVEVQELAALAGPEVLSAPGADLLSDELLLERCLRGEPGHYEVLMRRTAARLFRVARGICGSTPRALDVVQSSFVRAFESLANYDRQLRLGDWLTRIAIHGALGALRRDANKTSDSAPAPRSLDLVRQLESTVDALPQAHRVAFTLCVLDTMPPADVAAALGETVEAVSIATFRGRLRVRRQLGMRYDEAEARAFGLDLVTITEIVSRVNTRLGV